ncbi:MAG: hypothetical protein FWD86_01155 [Firmicutes bacterium]|nr:hypothetical protein [Bacillota bacterium]
MPTKKDLDNSVKDTKKPLSDQPKKPTAQKTDTLPAVKKTTTASTAKTAATPTKSTKSTAVQNTKPTAKPAAPATAKPKTTPPKTVSKKGFVEVDILNTNFDFSKNDKSSNPDSKKSKPKPKQQAPNDDLWSIDIDTQNDDLWSIDIDTQNDDLWSIDKTKVDTSRPSASRDKAKQKSTPKDDEDEKTEDNDKTTKKTDHPFSDTDTALITTAQDDFDQLWNSLDEENDNADEDTIDRPDINIDPSTDTGTACLNDDDCDGCAKRAKGCTKSKNIDTDFEIIDESPPILKPVPLKKPKSTRPSGQASTQPSPPSQIPKQPPLDPSDLSQFHRYEKIPSREQSRLYLEFHTKNYKFSQFSITGALCYFLFIIMFLAGVLLFIPGLIQIFREGGMQILNFESDGLLKLNELEHIGLAVANIGIFGIFLLIDIFTRHKSGLDNPKPVTLAQKAFAQIWFFAWSAAFILAGTGLIIMIIGAVLRFTPVDMPSFFPGIGLIAFYGGIIFLCINFFRKNTGKTQLILYDKWLMGEKGIVKGKSDKEWEEAGGGKPYQ